MNSQAGGSAPRWFTLVVLVAIVAGIWLANWLATTLSQP